jgi:hypothetical protein
MKARAFSMLPKPRACGLPPEKVEVWEGEAAL